MNASLPIGTVVLLNGGTHKVMITGYYAQMDDNKVFDYMGVMYPEGMVTFDKTLLFNHADIVQIFNQGYVDEDQKTYMTKLNEMAKQSQTQ